ncbi:MAG: hypothetical protein NTW16_01825 [Bacteroidetes bacterium]|nr:hypothetical protein [Bacteroidota bacterium]
MKTKLTFFGLTLAQFLSLFTLITGIVSIWIHLEIRIAEVNADITNLKQEMIWHKTENRRDFEIFRNDQRADTREIIRKVEEIQIYLRKK